MRSLVHANAKRRTAPEGRLPSWTAFTVHHGCVTRPFRPYHYPYICHLVGQERNPLFRRKVPCVIQQQEKVISMSVQFSRQGMTAMPLAVPVPKSPFIRRLLEARDDPVKARILTWLLEIDDARLLGFGLGSEDIALLRGVIHRRSA
jgi:hypothetical protein